MTEKEKVEEPFSLIGCRSCGESGKWEIYTDGYGRFKAKHDCGHISSFLVVTEPDRKAYNMRLFL